MAGNDLIKEVREGEMVARIDLNKPVQVLSFVAEMVEDGAHKQAQTTLLVAIYHELLKITGDGE